MSMNQKIPLDECLVEYRNDNGQIYMRFEDGTVLRLAEASQRSEKGTRRVAKPYEVVVTIGPKT